MNSDLLPIAIIAAAIIQLVILICFFVLVYHVEKLHHEATAIRKQQLPALSAQLQEISARLAELASRQ